MRYQEPRLSMRYRERVSGPETQRSDRSSRSRTVRVPIVEEVGHEAASASPQAFHVPVVEGLPAQYQELLVEPEIDPYTVIRNGDGSVIIGCGICPKEFGTLKGWRIHAAKMHTQNGFCHKCGHFVKMPHVRSAEE
uniref:C2H2-type domain-containing protein n=1 Tax=Loa loa TaxID=7209 RepID=A0A1I7VG36_LOALO